MKWFSRSMYCAVKIPPTTSGGIGVAYVEVPLEELKGDLNACIEFTFTHYEQHFQVVSGSQEELRLYAAEH